MIPHQSIRIHLFFIKLTSHETVFTLVIQDYILRLFLALVTYLTFFTNQATIAELSEYLDAVYDLTIAYRNINHPLLPKDEGPSLTGNFFLNPVKLTE